MAVMVPDLWPACESSIEGIEHLAEIVHLWDCDGDFAGTKGSAFKKMADVQAKRCEAVLQKMNQRIEELRCLTKVEATAKKVVSKNANKSEADIAAREVSELIQAGGLKNTCEADLSKMQDV